VGIEDPEPGLLLAEKYSGRVEDDCKLVGPWLLSGGVRNFDSKIGLRPATLTPTLSGPFKPCTANMAESITNSPRLAYEFGMFNMATSDLQPCHFTKTKVQSCRVSITKAAKARVFIHHQRSESAHAGHGHRGCYRTILMEPIPSCQPNVSGVECSASFQSVFIELHAPFPSLSASIRYPRSVVCYYLSLRASGQSLLPTANRLAALRLSALDFTAPRQSSHERTFIAVTLLLFKANHYAIAIKQNYPKFPGLAAVLSRRLSLDPNP
jgi:hypothetical protein